MSFERGIELQILGICILIAIGAWYWAVRQVQLWQRGPMLLSDTSASTAPDGTTLAWAGRAVANPPADLLTTLSYCQDRWGRMPLLFPLGWYQRSSGSADCVAASFLDDTYHILISGQSRIGKDNLMLQILFALTIQYPPERVQCCIIDGKGLDFTSFSDKAHIWGLADDLKAIQPMMAALTHERERRATLLRAARVSKWENYRGKDVPLLICYISELSLLEDATSRNQLTAWLNSELAASAAFGIRYIVATQTASNFHTRWRSQISLYLAGFQPSQSQDEPNTGLTTREIREAGGIPPSELRPYPDGAGVFLAVHGRDVETIRTGYLSDEQRHALLQRLPTRTTPRHTATPHDPLHPAHPHATPDATPASERHIAVRPSALQTGYPTGSHAPESARTPTGGSSSGSGVAVTAAERTAILHARERMITSGQPISRRAICRQVFNGATGGAAYRKVQTVLDAEGENQDEQLAAQVRGGL